MAKLDRAELNPEPQWLQDQASEQLYATCNHYLARVLTKSRYLHSLRVADYAATLALRFGCNVVKAGFAGLMHDLARELSEAELLSLAMSAQEPIDPFVLSHPVLLHGMVAAIIMQREFKLDDPEILEAVRNHSLGRQGMGSIAKILFVADYMEPKRSYISASFRKHVESYSLNKMALVCIEHNRKLHRKELMPELTAMLAAELLHDVDVRCKVR